MAQSKPQFQIYPLSSFCGASATIKRPQVYAALCEILNTIVLRTDVSDPRQYTQEVTSFSFDEQHKLRHDDSSLRWYWPPKLGAALSRGFETFVKHDDLVDEHLDGLLAAILKLEEKTGERVVADFVTWRGMMTKVSSDQSIGY